MSDDDGKNHPSRFSTKPLYQQLHDALAKRISSEEWKPGAALPNETDLAREVGVSPGTMRKALDLLESEHLVTRRQGRGTFVNDQSSHELALRFTNIRDRHGARLADAVASDSIATGEASDIECGRLGLQPREPVYRIRRVRTSSGRPFIVDETTMPAARFPGLSDRKHRSQRICVLLGQYGVLPGRALEQVSIGAATPAVANVLGLAAGSPILVLDRIVYDLDDDPVEWRMAYCHLVDECYVAEMS
jgi:GntR family transcriptional regulator